ncbi:hypothetical protein L1987_77593 [Smallanthus sonchifolius]|uniref:Uncharacterized protein n=1 Tax=Smallanthus sonchifolius TaxID=185202 RepID=A0ACB8ZAA6_9ASTR|nr:hypothetical protein L1987_77593 [Smallanthus sonchifolius]
MHVTAVQTLQKCFSCQKRAPKTLKPKNDLIPVTGAWPFQKWGIYIVGQFPEAPGRIKFLIVAVDYFTKWVEAKAVATITTTQIKKFVWDYIICRFGLPLYLVSDNGTQFESLAGWEQALIQEAKYKQVLAKYYNKNVALHQFRPGEYVFRNNEASRAEPGGKLGPNWEGPYQIKESLGKGAHSLTRLDGTNVPRTWNAAQLKKCRAHLLSAHRAGPAHLLSAQEEEPAHLLSAQEEEPAHLLSAQEGKTVHLLSAQEAVSAHLLNCVRSSRPLQLRYQMLLVQDVRYGFYPLVRTFGFVNGCTTGMSDGGCSGGPRNLPLALEMARRGGNRGSGGGRRGGRTGRHGGASTNQVIEGSVHTTHTDTVVSQHNAEHVEGDDQTFEFEPVVQAALGREFTRLLKETLPAILDEALRKAKENSNVIPAPEGPVVLPAAGGPVLVENVAPPTRGCDYKAFRGCDPPELTGEKEAAYTLDWINGMESTISLSDCRPDQAVRFAAKSLKGEAAHWWETVKQAKGDQAVELMRWNDLKALVISKFCPKNEVHKVERI